MSASSRIIIGNATTETRAIQGLALALSQAASWTAKHVSDSPRSLTIPPLLHGAAHAVALASLNGPDTPLEVVALSTRNTFELFLRLKYLLLSHANCQQWREEAVTDQLQIYEGILSMDGPEAVKKIIRAEMDRVRQHATKRRLTLKGKIRRVYELVGDKDLDAEYRAFYKFYSKLVHPSSFLVNWPNAAATPIFRTTLVFNLQWYGHLILDELQVAVGLPATEVLDDARRRYNDALRPGPSST